MDGGVVMEVGAPVAQRQTGEGEIVAGVLPAGRYASLTHIGHPDELVRVTGELLAWGEKHSIKWDAEGNNWGCRLEVYKSNPEEVPDMNDWETELLFRLRS